MKITKEKTDYLLVRARGISSGVDFAVITISDVLIMQTSDSAVVLKDLECISGAYDIHLTDYNCSYLEIENSSKDLFNLISCSAVVDRPYMFIDEELYNALVTKCKKETFEEGRIIVSQRHFHFELMDITENVGSYAKFATKKIPIDLLSFYQKDWY